MRFKKLTPILTVEAIEPCMPFWVDKLGFEKTVEVPEGDRLGFVILARDGVEVMYQTRSSVLADLGTPIPVGGALYLDVDELASVVAALEGAEVVVSERTTFYGSRELFVREPGGHLIGFAQHHPA